MSLKVVCSNMSLKVVFSNMSLLVVCRNMSLYVGCIVPFTVKYKPIKSAHSVLHGESCRLDFKGNPDIKSNT